MTTKTFKIFQREQEVMSITITVPDNTTYDDIQWDSKTGLVTAKVNGASNRTLIPFTGVSLGALEPEPYTTENITSMKHHYWYY